MKRKYYISGPMSGILDLNFPAFELAAAYLKSQGHEVFSPHQLGKDIEYRKAMAIDLLWIADNATNMLMLPGWERSPGARAEWHVAVAVGIPITYTYKDSDIV